MCGRIDVVDRCRQGVVMGVHDRRELCRHRSGGGRFPRRRRRREEQPGRVSLRGEGLRRSRVPRRQTRVSARSARQRRMAPQVRGAGRSAEKPCRSRPATVTLAVRRRLLADTPSGMGIACLLFLRPRRQARLRRARHRCACPLSMRVLPTPVVPLPQAPLRQVPFGARPRLPAMTRPAWARRPPG